MIIFNSTSAYIKYWNKDGFQNSHMIKDLLEAKTTWHPIENIGVFGAVGRYYAILYNNIFKEFIIGFFFIYYKNCIIVRC